MDRYSEIAMPAEGRMHSVEATSFLAGVYMWMFVGLGLTSVVAAFVASSPSLVLAIAENKILFWGLFLCELGIVIFLTSAINRISAGVATLAFLVFSAINGATCSFLLLIYTGESVLMAFVAATCLFGTLSLYGYVTRRDLTSLGSLLIIALVAQIVCSLINLFLHSPAFYHLLGFTGIVIFLGLTAHDTQKILRVGARVHTLGASAVRKMAIIGALELYLDFINLFIYLLRIFGKRR